jgi:nucleotide-binding universal stress UspA family protein
MRQFHGASPARRTHPGIAVAAIRGIPRPDPQALPMATSAPGAMIGSAIMSRRTIMVGFDGSRRALDALQFAERLCAQTGWRLVLAGVYPYRSLSGRLGSGDRAAATLDAARARVRGGCETQMAPAPSVSAGLRAIADSMHADLIVLGSRHRGRLGEALAGRTARALLRDGTHAVAIVPAGHRAGPVGHVGVLAEDSEAGREAWSTAASLARGAGASVTVHGGSVPSWAADVVTAPEIADELARGELDVLIVPPWPHGLLGRLRRGVARGSSVRGDCPVLVAARPRPAPPGQHPVRHAEADRLAAR